MTATFRNSISFNSIKRNQIYLKNNNTYDLCLFKMLYLPFLCFFFLSSVFSTLSCEKSYKHLNDLEKKPFHKILRT